MDAFQALSGMPFGCGNQTDVENDVVFYDDGGEAMQVDHRHFQEGATFGDGYRKGSGKFTKIEEIRSRRITS